MTTHARSGYLPRTLVATEDRELKWTPDYLNAPYLNLNENVTTYSTHVISQAFEGRPDLIAHKVYGSVALWWVICQFNGVVNPFTDLYVGKLVKVPDYSQLMHVLHEEFESTAAFLQGKNSSSTAETISTVLV